MAEVLRLAEVDRPQPSTRRAEVLLQLTEFDIPPVQDCLILGKRAPIGTEAARLMIESVAPGQFEVVRVEHPTIEAVIVRKAILKAIPQERLVGLVIEEAEKMLSDFMALKARIHVTVHAAREVHLG